jgi:sugar transferase (PEP-CTERM system associated)
MNFLRFSYQVKRALMFLSEGILIFLSVVAGVYFRMGSLDHELIIPKALLTTGVCLISLYYADLYDPKIIKDIRELLIRLMQALGVASIVLAVIFYVYPVLMIGRGASLVSACLIIVLIVSWRLLYRSLLMLQGMEERILIVGTNPFAIELAEEITAQSTLGYRVVGYIGRDPGRTVGNPIALPVLADLPGIAQVVQDQRINQIIVSLSERRGRLPMEHLVECKMAGVDVNEGVSFFERITGKILIDKLRPSWLIFSSGFDKSRLFTGTKRILEFTLSLIALLLLLPVILLIAVLIRLDSPGPAFFKQKRVGEQGRHFVLYKYRSMAADAESETGPIWAGNEDDRVTRMGLLLRKTRLDELPQLFNVLKGDMSFVGPRPERPYFVAQLYKEIPYYGIRHSVKPGITGWAQVRYSYGASVEDAKEKLQYDLFYIKHMSLFLDLEVILDTIKVVFLKRGAR